MIVFKYIKNFTEAQLSELFLSVDWYSGNFSKKLKIDFTNKGYKLEVDSS